MAGVVTCDDLKEPLAPHALRTAHAALVTGDKSIVFVGWDRHPPSFRSPRGITNDIKQGGSGVRLRMACAGCNQAPCLLHNHAVMSQSINNHFGFQIPTRHLIDTANECGPVTNPRLTDATVTIIASIKRTPRGQTKQTGQQHQAGKHQVPSKDE
jgi:hypothetical protein